MKRLALGLAWTAGLAALAAAAWAAVALGFLPAVLFGLAAGLVLRAAWRRVRAAPEPSEPAAFRLTRPPPAPRSGAGRAGAPEPGVPEADAPAGAPPQTAAAPARRPRFRLVWILPAGVVVAGGALLLVFWSPIAERGMELAPPVGTAGIGSLYRASVEPGPERGTLTVRERYAVAVSDVAASPDLESPEAFRPAEGRVPVPDGWEGALARDSVILTRERTVRMEVSLVRPTSVVTLRVPPVVYDGPVLWARPGSRIELDLPRHFLVASFPPSESTVDLLDPRGLERTVIPVTIAAGDPREVRLRVLHAALRHPVGASLTQASLLAPVKWAALALVAIFAEQIKARMLVPVARRIADALRLPLFEGQAGGGG